jgi:ubiquinone/menaquinone biosynthesis C-methylase UbiE
MARCSVLVAASNRRACSEWIQHDRRQLKPAPSTADSIPASGGLARFVSMCGPNSADNGGTCFFQAPHRIRYSVASPPRTTAAMYVCPKCKGSLSDFYCAACSVRYPVAQGIPCFLEDGPQSSDSKIREIYDDIYLHHTNVWADQGRSLEFQTYFSELVREVAGTKVLEIGCGEGDLQVSLPASLGFGIDPSLQALLRAQKRSRSTYAVARCEHLPYPAGAFDVVFAVGVMEHFENIDLSLSEIRRVLLPGGHYIALIQTDLTGFQRVAVKVREYMLPRPRPVALARWLLKYLKKKTKHPIVQPLRKSYTADSARDCMQRNALDVVRIIDKRTTPTAPLAGPHVVIFIARKRPDQ